MTATLTPNGLSIDDFEIILEEIQTAFIAAYGAGIKTEVKSGAGQLQRIIAARDQQWQEILLSVYTGLDPRLAEGVLLDRSNSLLGLTRLPDTPAEVLGTYTGTPTTVIPAGSRVSVGTPANIFATDVEYIVGGGGTIDNVLVIAELPGEVDVSILGAWTLEDAIGGITGFDDDSQPVLGRVVELDADFRARGDIERFRRGIGPLAAIDATLIAVAGVTFAKSFENVTVSPTDSNGIDLHGIKAVVEGGTDLDVATAMRNSFPAGHQSFGAESQVLNVGPDQRTWFFDRVAEVPVYVRAEFLTSTSEESTPADLDATAKAALMEFAMGPIDPATGNRSTTQGAWQIGTDVLSNRLEGALADITGADDVTVTTSLDDVSYISTKRAISIVQRAVLAEVRITISEV